MVSKIPSYLVKYNQSNYYFQLRIPQHIKRNCNISQIFFRKSLRTKDQRVAINKSRRLYLSMDDLIKKYFNSPKAYGKAQELLMRYESFNTNSWEEVEEQLFQFDEESEMPLLEKAISLKEEQVKQDTDKSKEITFLKNVIDKFVAKNQNNNSKTSTNSILLSSVLEKYIKESSKNWKDKTIQKTEEDYRNKIQLFIDIIGDKSSDTLIFDDINKYKENLFNFPSNRTKSKKYRNKSIPEIMSMSIPNDDVLSTNSLSNHINKVKAFLNWAGRNKYIDDNLTSPLEKVIKRSISEDEERDVFDDNDLKKLFLSNEYIMGGFKKPSHFWTPLIALYTGARLNEICQLYVDDIIQGDINYFNLNDKDDKTLKQKSHARNVPIHSDLIKLGLFDYLAEIKRLGHNRLFPDLVKARDGYGSSVSKWFNRTYRKNCNVGQDKNENKVFHSFRHTVINYFKQNGFEEWKVSQLVGQKPGTTGITYNRYGKKEILAEQDKLIQALNFQIDFTKIKNWTFISRKCAIIR